MNILWGECTWEDIKRAAQEAYVVVFPVGAIEQHGPMLPVDTDARIAEKAAVDAARVARDEHGVKVLVLPTLAYGQSCHHMNFAGTISLRFDTYIAAMCDIMREVVRHGFRKIVFVNGNGGNENAIEVARYRLMEEFAGRGEQVRVYRFPGWADARFRDRIRRAQEQLGAEPEGQMAIHAAAHETSETLADRPHLVKRDKMTRPTLKVDEVPRHAWRTDEITETGAFGDPSKARADLGEAFWKAWADSIAEYLADVASESDGQ
ncbi:MAG: creatininase family protein [Armatimonadota bacterium]